MREVKGSYLLWGTVVVYLLYLFLSLLGITYDVFFKVLLIALAVVGVIGTAALVFISQIVAPLNYSFDYDYDKRNYKSDLTYKKYYLSEYSTSSLNKYIRFSLVY